jgi:ligand-binding sensor domain-containing protein
MLPAICVSGGAIGSRVASRRPGCPPNWWLAEWTGGYLKVVENQFKGNVPSSDMHSLAVDPQSATTLYVGADIGVFVSHDDGANWFDFSQPLPNAVINQIFWDGAFLYATTYGRGLWRRQPGPFAG